MTMQTTLLEQWFVMGFVQGQIFVAAARFPVEFKSVL